MCEKVLKKSMCVLISIALVIQFVPSNAFAKAQTSTTSNDVELMADSVDDASLQATTKYTVTFNSNGGSSVAKQTVTSGNKATKPANPTKTGYTFAGWYTDNKTFKNAYNFSTKVTASKTLYAKWTANKYTITFNSNGGSNVASQSVEYNNKVTKPTIPTRRGYQFAWWCSDSKLTRIYDFNTKVTSKLTLYAKWTLLNYPITYNLDGGNNDSGNPTSYNVETNTITLKDPTREGYNFLGWTKTDVKNPTKNLRIEKGSIEKKEFTANWIRSSCSVCLDYGYEYENEKKIEEKSVPYGDVLTEPNTPTRKHYTFGGWYTNEECSHSYDFGKTVDSNFTLYAKWDPDVYTVTFDSNGGSKIKSQSVKYHDCIQPTDTPKRNGYTFLYWCYDKDLNYKVNYTIPIASNKTLYAKWEVNDYDVRFDSKGGTPVTTQSVKYRNKAIKPKNPTRKGYTFKGWFTDEKCTKEYKFGAVTKDVTLYAKWASNASSTNKSTKTTSVLTMYRLYNQYTGEHFYTSSTNEKANLVKSGWKYEGVGWKAPKTSRTPVYRLYNKYVSGGDHHYTTSKSEKDSLVRQGWKYEGIGWYSDDNKGVPLYRQYNPFAKSGTHNYTSKKSENNNLVKNGWKAENIAWYGVK